MYSEDMDVLNVMILYYFIGCKVLLLFNCFYEVLNIHLSFFKFVYLFEYLFLWKHYNIYKYFKKNFKT